MISIIIPTYNHGRVLLDCLDSIFKQSVDLEVIVVNDGSTDQTAELLEGYRKKLSSDHRFTYLVQSQAGAPAARNAGARRAVGEYILFSDADLIWEPGAFSKLENALRTNPDVSFVYPNFRFGRREFRGQEFNAVSLRDNNYIHTSALMRRVDFPGFDERLKRFQDWDLWLTIAESGKKGLWLNEKLFSAQISRPGISSWRPKIWYEFWAKWPTLAPAEWLNYQTAKQLVKSKHEQKGPDSMADVAIIIPTWNSAAEIVACLQSLKEPANVRQQIIVVDNGSTDRTLSLVKENAPNASVIHNKYNLGFARACNQGATLANARYLFFLNPDAEVRPGCLSELVSFLDEQPNVGVLGPQILNHNGSIQPSCRRFPTFLSLLLDLLKLQTVLPNLKAVMKYRMTAFRHNTLRQVDQVMGAALFIRGDLFHNLKGFDQGYFIWFEDADLCKRVVDAGKIIFFFPYAQIQHGLSLSFKKTNRWWRQWQFAKSARRYAARHLSPVASFFVSIVSWTALPLAIFGGTRNFKNRDIRTDAQSSKGLPFRWWFYIFLAIDLFSLLVHFRPIVSNLVWSVAVIVFLLLAWKQIESAVLLAIAELIIGSHGYQLAWHSPEASVSLRQAMYVVLVSVSTLRLLRQHSFTWIRNAWPIFTLLAVAGWAIFVGYIRNNNLDDIISDGNGFAFLLFILPLFVVSYKSDDFFEKVWRVILAAGVYLSIKSLFILYFLTHSFGWWRHDLYTWLRDTRVAELTPTPTGAYRIFMPGQIWLLVIWLGTLWQSLKGKDLKMGLVGILTSATLLISFSRSFWLGWLITTSLLVLVTAYVKRQKLFSIIRNIIWYFAGGFVVVTALLLFPWPSSTSTGDLALQSRLDVANEAAASSRWKLLGPLMYSVGEHPYLGSGFGTPVTYISDDPRIRAVYPDGRYTTTAFEWGYLDMWQEFGALALVVFMLSLVSILRIIWQSNLPSLYKVIFGIGLLAVMLVHATTPYLDHPIGLGFLVLALAVATSGSQAPVDKSRFLG